MQTKKFTFDVCCCCCCCCCILALIKVKVRNVLTIGFSSCDQGLSGLDGLLGVEGNEGDPVSKNVA